MNVKIMLSCGGKVGGFSHIAVYLLYWQAGGREKSLTTNSLWT